MKQQVRSNWSTAVLVCAKCSKKLDGGFGPKGRTPLGKALRKHLGLKKGRKGAAGIVEVGCLKVCPKGAVTVVNGAASREWLIVPEGADLGSLAIELALIPSRHPREGGGPSPASDAGITAVGPVAHSGDGPPPPRG